MYTSSSFNTAQYHLSFWPLFSRGLNAFSTSNLSRRLIVTSLSASICPLCTCTEDTNVTLPSLAQTPPWIMDPHGACRDSFPTKCYTCAQRTPGTDNFSGTKICNQVLFSSPAQVSGAPALISMSTKPTYQRLRFRQAGTRVYQQISFPSDQCCYRTQSFWSPLLFLPFLLTKLPACAQSESRSSPQGLGSCASFNAQDQRAGWGTGSGYTKSPCVTETHKVPISPISPMELITTAIWPVSKLGPNILGTQLSCSRICTGNNLSA